MKGYMADIEKLTLENEHFRKVLYTGKHLQLVLMSLKTGEEIGEETHENVDQFFRFEAGAGKCMIDDAEHIVHAGDIIIIPAGAKHNVLNTDSVSDLKLYTIYSPPNHKEGTLRITKEDAENKAEAFDGTTTE